jgi:hypothetical protein
VKKADEVNGVIVNLDPNAVIAELYSVVLLFTFQLLEVGDFLN